MVALALLALQSAKKLFQKGNLEKTFVHEALVLIPTCIGDFFSIFSGTFP